MIKNIELLILSGLPASGKSTLAKRICEENPTEWVRICRDSIRECLGVYWVPKREPLVTEIENDSVQSALLKGYNVVVDATNLNGRDHDRWYKIAEDINQLGIYNVTVKFHMVYVTLQEAIWRDFWRRVKPGQRSVGRKVIKNFYKKYFYDSGD